MNPAEPQTAETPATAEPGPEGSDAVEADAVLDPFAEAHADMEQLRSDADEEAEQVKAQKSFWRELPILILIALVVAVVIKTFFIQAFFIPSGSMKETLQVNDRVLVNKLAYRFGDIQRGDVIVFDDPRGDAAETSESVIGALVRNLAESVGLSTPQSEFIKRVVALEGETIEVVDGTVFIDGAPLDEAYLRPGLRLRDFDAVTVPEGEVFVMGDNRNSSVDSTVFGPIPVSDIVGKAFVVVWPPSNWGGL